MAINISIANNYGGSGQVGGHRHEEEKLEKPDRNPFLDFLTAPLQAIGKQGGNQNDKEYGKYAQAATAGNLLKGF